MAKTGLNLDDEDAASLDPRTESPRYNSVSR
jgi:hypothetical protein